MRLREKKGPRKKKKFNDHVLTPGRGEGGTSIYKLILGCVALNGMALELF